MPLIAVNTIIIFLGFAGFFIAFYISHHKKNSQEALVCPLKANCDTVIHSDYSKFMGISVELLGMTYYAFIAVSYGIFLIFPALLNPFFIFILYLLSLSAFLFSIYLTFIQALAIKNWCTWCLISACISTTILLVSINFSPYPLEQILVNYKDLILLGHVLAMSLGVGSATILDVLFFRFLRDLKISEEEADVLNTISNLVWFVLALAVVTGIMLYIPEADELSQSPRFIAKLIVVGVIIINGAFLNLLISPRLVKISFGNKNGDQMGELSFLRKLAFLLGGVSITSWYSAFILASLKNLSYNLITILMAYILLVCFAMIMSQIMERRLSKGGNI